MYTEPTWIELLLKSSILYIIEIIIITLITLITYKITKKITKKQTTREATILITITILLLLAIPTTGILWNNWMEKPSVRTTEITITDIQPTPGMVKMDKNGYTIDNSNQLMFITNKGEFQNTEKWEFNKFDTRTIFNQLRINGTYKIKYYGWRNGHNNEFPNILSVEETINENNTTPNNFNKYFGTHKGSQEYNLGIQQ